MSAIAHGEQVRVLEEHVEGGRSLNWWGMIFFISSEALIFANLIAAFLYLEIRGISLPGFQWVLPSGELLDWRYAGVNTIILIASSFPVHMAGRAMARGDRRRAIMALIPGIILGAIFLGGQAYEYAGLYAQGFTLQYKAFGSGFFTLTGFHGLHVTIGLIFLIIVLIRTIRGDFTAQKHFALQAGEMYWHFVDIVWIFVYATVYLLPNLLPH